MLSMVGWSDAEDFSDSAVADEKFAVNTDHRGNRVGILPWPLKFGNLSCRPVSFVSNVRAAGLCICPLVTLILWSKFSSHIVPVLKMN